MLYIVILLNDVVVDVRLIERRKGFSSEGGLGVQTSFLGRDGPHDVGLHTHGKTDWGASIKFPNSTILKKFATSSSHNKSRVIIMETN